MRPRGPHLAQVLGRRATGGPAFLPDPPMGDAPPSIAQGAPRLQSYRVYLDQARSTPERIALSGSMLWVQDAAHPHCEATIHLGTPQGAGLCVRQGFKLSGFSFSEVWIENKAQSTAGVWPNWIDLVAGVPDGQLEMDAVAVRPGANMHHYWENVVINAERMILEANHNRLWAIIKPAYTGGGGYPCAAFIKDRADIPTFSGIPLFCRAAGDEDMIQLHTTDRVWATAWNGNVIVRTLECFTV